jgi:hypothetical protein
VVVVRGDGGCELFEVGGWDDAFGSRRAKYAGPAAVCGGTKWSAVSVYDVTG